MTELNLDQLTFVMPKLPFWKAKNYLPYLNDALKEFGIDTPARIAAFIAQLAHESGELNKWSENLNYSAVRIGEVFKKYFKTVSPAAYAHKPEKLANRVYGGRMGNGPESSGDGWRYRGRGPIALTGKDNYHCTGAALRLDLVAQPELAEQPDIGFRIAGYFWKSHNLNALADDYADPDKFDAITKTINGGLNGKEERDTYYARALEAMGLVTRPVIP